MTRAALRLRCLEIAAAQVGGWDGDELSDHASATMALAVTFEVFVREGYEEACVMIDWACEPEQTLQ